ncbi:MAG: hypothetical protein LR008_01080 [Candidatus Pacebacteria bacterium]|nr:hypothetical protein [Candidatus Paceibacterota bacterium]
MTDKYLLLDKKVGETPLSCAEDWRAEHPELNGVSMAYAGRLDPMASGKLLILLGDECKKQTDYHGLDKAYKFSVLLGIESDSLDVLGRLKTCPTSDKDAAKELNGILNSLTGKIELPYPRFSAKTVQGKPLHTWTMENRLDEIEIPTKESEIYTLEFDRKETLTKEDLVKSALEKVNSIPPVTELRKALGNDFRRVDVRKDWNNILKDNSLPENFDIVHLNCIASSGTYMRTLAGIIAKKLGTCGLAWSIHRDTIGIYDSQNSKWIKEY